jgi:polyphenol oxidase
MLTSSLLNRIPELQHGFSFGGDVPAGVFGQKQVHRSAWLWLPAQSSVPQDKLPVDAIATNRSQFPIGVYSADCVPVLLALRKASGPLSAIAAIHAGWRGSAQCITERVTRALLQMQEASATEAWELYAAIGPCISPRAFEVGPEVPAAFLPDDREALASSLREENGRQKFLVDLRSANRRQLEKACAGRATLYLDTLDSCTVEDLALPSYRRQGKAAGRILSFIALR